LTHILKNYLLCTRMHSASLLHWERWRICPALNSLNRS